MRRIGKISLLAILAVTLFSGAACAHVYLKGSDVAQHFPRLAAGHYEKSGDVSVISMKKNAAIELLATDPDSCDVALSTWPLDALDDAAVLQALADAEALGIEFSQTPFVVDAIPPVLHKDNPVDALTLEQLHKIYTGEITKWHQIDGSIDEAVDIEVYTTGNDDSKYIIWKAIVLRGKADVGAAGPKDVSPFIASDDHKWAIGFDSMYYIKPSDEFKNGDIKIPQITNPEGLSAGPSKEYPVSRYLYLITRSDVSDEAMAFADFLRRADTQQLAYDVYQLPLPVEETVHHSSSSNCNATGSLVVFLLLAPLCCGIRKKK